MTLTSVPFYLAVLTGIPAIYLLAVVYTSPAIPTTVATRKLDIRSHTATRGRAAFIFDMALTFRTAQGETLKWSQQLPAVHLEEALMFFDTYPPGKQVPIFRFNNDVVLRRGLPDWRFGVGWAAAGFTLVLLFFGYAGASFSNSGWFFRPQRTFALFGLIPLIGGYLMYNVQTAKAAWPRVQAHIEEVLTLPLLESRAPDLTFDAGTRKLAENSKFETIAYSHGGRDYLYPYGTDVTIWQDPTQRDFDKIVNPADPSSLSDIPPPGDEKTTVGKVLMAAGGLFIFLGLIL